jgi:hypothetical protein
MTPNCLLRMIPNSSVDFLTGRCINRQQPRERLHLHIVELKCADGTPSPAGPSFGRSTGARSTYVQEFGSVTVKFNFGDLERAESPSTTERFPKLHLLVLICFLIHSKMIIQYLDNLNMIGVTQYTFHQWDPLGFPDCNAGVTHQRYRSQNGRPLLDKITGVLHTDFWYGITGGMGAALTERDDDRNDSIDSFAVDVK